MIKGEGGAFCYTSGTFYDLLFLYLYVKRKVEHQEDERGKKEPMA